MEHLRSVRPSALINIYLLLTLVFDIVRTRTLWQTEPSKTIAAVSSSSVGVKVLMLIVEAVEKRDILLVPFQHTSPEVTSGIYSRSMFWWLNKLMRTGFKRIINNDDLYPIEDEMRTSTLLHNARKSWIAQDKNHSNALMWSTMKALKLSVAHCLFPRLCLVAFKYAQPFLISRTINFANSPNESNNIGWGLTAAYGFVFVGMAICNGAYYHMAYRFVTALRGSLVTLIYQKTVDLSITALDESAALTLMSTDTETICDGLQQVHELWAVPIEVGIALWILYRDLGFAFIGPAILAICELLFHVWYNSVLTQDPVGATGGIIGMANIMGNAQKTWIQGIQTRVDVTSAMLSVMKVRSKLNKLRTLDWTVVLILLIGRQNARLYRYYDGLRTRT